MKGKRKITVLLLIVVMLSSLMVGCEEKNKEKYNDFKIVAFDVGKADAFLLTTEKGTVLIDTGEDEDGKKIVQYLKNEGIESIDYLVITHFDKDHVGGANKIIKEISVGNVIQSVIAKESTDINEYNKALSKKEINPTTLREKLSFVLDSVEYTIYPPEKEVYENEPSNDTSLIVSVKHGENKFLFMGDACDERIEEYLKEEDLNHIFLKMPYHGHYLAKNEDLLKAVKPKYAVITSSKDEPKEKELAKTEEMLKTIGSKVYFTNNGNVICESDGYELKITQEEN